MEDMNFISCHMTSFHFRGLAVGFERGGRPFKSANWTADNFVLSSGAERRCFGVPQMVQRWHRTLCLQPHPFSTSSTRFYYNNRQIGGNSINVQRCIQRIRHIYFQKIHYPKPHNSNWSRYTYYRYYTYNSTYYRYRYYTYTYNRYYHSSYFISICEAYLCKIHT